MSQAGVLPTTSKLGELRAAARLLQSSSEPEDVQLAGLLGGVADAYEEFQKLDPVPIEEAIRWTPVLLAALRLAREVLS
jgi:hypothetical protein